VGLMANITQKEYIELAGFIKKNYGIDLGTKKQELVMNRLNNVLLQLKMSCFSEYFNYITSDQTGTAMVTLVNNITTNHTFFMRENDHFIFFKDTVLPYLINTQRNKDLRIWSAGCSTGEEPYTLAMIIDDFLGKDKIMWDAKVLATDISSKVLDIAIKAEYSNDQTAKIPPIWYYKYFNKSKSQNFSIVDKIRNEVIFRKFNLMDQVFPFKQKFHVIFCRNVMIYFDNDTKYALTDKFYNLLEPGGYLFIGHSESLHRDRTKFKYIKPAIYRKE
jgi:chemotaxis protein methyltransferase CheR